MRRIHLDAVGGIAGDMFVAAMLDAFPDLAPRVLADAAMVLPAGLGKPAVEETTNGGLRALRFRLAGKGHDDDAHRHGPDDGSFPALAARIETVALSQGTAAASLAVLRILAEAEARIHGVPMERVHFHEIADWDSLLDVVAAGSIAAALTSARWSVSALPRGGGMVGTAHGLLPVPAPATVAILEGFMWRDDGIAGERVTPTGAAILKYLVAAGPTETAGQLAGSGTGAGSRSLAGVPNVLRALVFEEAATTGDRVCVIAFEIDDMTGEEVGVAADRLRTEAGVLDVSIGERWGKKGRPVQAFQILARPDAGEAVIRRCFAETSTIGLRVSEETRLVLNRNAGAVGGIRVKSVRRPESGTTRKAESDDLRGDTLALRRRMKQEAEDGGR